MTTWLQTYKNYPVFLRNDIDDMERNKKEKIRFIRDSKTRFHSLTYKLNHTEIELDTARREIEGWKEKEEDLHIEKDYLFNLQSELQQECDFKEFRRMTTMIDTTCSWTKFVMFETGCHYSKGNWQPLNTNWNGWQTKSTHVEILNGR